MRNLFTSISASAVVALISSSAFAQSPAPATKARPATPAVQQQMIIVTSPDGRVYASDMRQATSPSGHRLEKLNVDEKSAGSQRVSGTRLADWIKTHTPKQIGGAPCSMEYPTFRVKISGTAKLAELTGTHGACAKQVAKQGTLVACPQDTTKLFVLWAGETAPAACPIPTQR